MGQQMVRKKDRDVLESDKQALEASLKSGALKAPGAARKQLREVEAAIERARVPKMDAVETDRIANREKEALARITSDGMPSMQEMRANAPGTVGQHIEWERKHKKDVLQWKDDRIRLQPDNDDPDYTNIEVHRPRTNTRNVSGVNAQIEPKTIDHPSQAFMQGYDSINWDSLSDVVKDKIREAVFVLGRWIPMLGICRNATFPPRQR